MLVLENTSLVLEKIRLIFFDFGLILKDCGSASSETDLYSSPRAYTYMHTYTYHACVYKANQKTGDPHDPCGSKFGGHGVVGAAYFPVSLYYARVKACYIKKTHHHFGPHKHDVTSKAFLSSNGVSDFFVIKCKGRNILP